MGNCSHLDINYTYTKYHAHVQRDKDSCEYQSEWIKGGPVHHEVESLGGGPKQVEGDLEFSAQMTT